MKKIYHSSFDNSHWSFANSTWKCNVELVFAPAERDVYRTRARQKILLAPAERNMSRSPGQSGKCCAPLERQLSGFIAVSINISLRWSENQLDVALPS